MARQPTHKTSHHLLLYHISLYYVMRERIPGIKFRVSDHIIEIEKEECRYHQQLAKFPDWNTEENRGRLRRDIDFLTGVFSKKAAEEKKKQELADLKGKVVVPAANTIYK